MVYYEPHGDIFIHRYSVCMWALGEAALVWKDICRDELQLLWMKGEESVYRVYLRVQSAKVRQHIPENRQRILAIKRAR